MPHSVANNPLWGLQTKMGQIFQKLGSFKNWVLILKENSAPRGSKFSPFIYSSPQAEGRENSPCLSYSLKGVSNTLKMPIAKN